MTKWSFVDSNMLKNATKKNFYPSRTVLPITATMTQSWHFNTKSKTFMQN